MSITETLKSVVGLFTTKNAFELELRAEIKKRLVLARWARKHRAAFAALPFQPKYWNGQFDFDHLTRDQIVQVMRALRVGKWIKTPSGDGKVDYEGVLDGVKIRMWQGEPPPSCRVVEEKRWVPDTVIPAHEEIVRKLVCSPAGGLEGVEDAG